VPLYVPSMMYLVCVRGQRATCVLQSAGANSTFVHALAVCAGDVIHNLFCDIPSFQRHFWERWLLQVTCCLTTLPVTVILSSAGLKMHRRETIGSRSCACCSNTMIRCRSYATPTESASPFLICCSQTKSFVSADVHSTRAELTIWGS
jgi:hypothetical protein